MKDILRKVARYFGIYRRYNRHTFLVEYYFLNQKIFSLFDKKALPLVVETQANIALNQLYTMQNILPEVHHKSFAQYKDSFGGGGRCSCNGYGT